MFRKLPVVALLSIMLSACAEPARVDQMVPTAATPLATGSPLENALCVTSVKGGEETNPLWTSEVDNAAFRDALEQALTNNRMAASGTAACAFDVEANLLGLAQPVAGFDMEVTANVNYSVLEHASQAPYFQSTVVTPYTADFSSAFLGIERLRLANEGAIRTNIEKFLEELSSHAQSNPLPAKPEGATPSS